MSAPWPPPPDLESIQQLVREADIENYIAEGAPEDEYEPEEEELFTVIAHLPTSQLIAIHLQPMIETIWRKSFSLDDTALDSRRPAIALLPKSRVSSARKPDRRSAS